MELLLIKGIEPLKFPVQCLPCIVNLSNLLHEVSLFRPWDIRGGVVVVGSGLMGAVGGDTLYSCAIRSFKQSQISKPLTPVDISTTD